MCFEELTEVVGHSRRQDVGGNLLFTCACMWVLVCTARWQSVCARARACGFWFVLQGGSGCFTRIPMKVSGDLLLHMCMSAVKKQVTDMQRRVSVVDC